MFWRLSLETNWYLVSSSGIFEFKHGVFGLKILPKPSPIHIWNENGGFIRVSYLPNINWPPWTASKKGDPNEHPIFSSNMDRGWLQEHFHLNQCMYNFFDGCATDTISIGLQQQPPVSSSVIFEFIHTLFWVEMILRSCPIHIWRENWVVIRVRFFGGCPLRPIDIWSLAQSSLNLNMEC